ncbi:MAG TPA: LLM class F420-dependent oxidoreductase [Dehalococcoidia bacterium]
MREQGEFAAAAEEAGFESVWVSEVAGYDAVTQAAAVGGRTRRLRVGTAIVPIYTRNPLLMAMTAASLHELLGGRFVLGLGTSTRVIMEEWHGTPWERPLATMRAYVTLLRRFLAGERLSTSEGPFRHRRAALGVRAAAAPPIFLGALNDRMLELAGEVADGVILNFASLRSVGRALERIEAGAVRGGRSRGDVEVAVFFRATLTPDIQPVRERYARELLPYLLAPVYRRMFAAEGLDGVCAAVAEAWSQGRRAEALRVVPEELVRERALVGTPEACHARLQAYAAAGVDTAIVLPVPRPDRDYEEEVRSMIKVFGAMAPAPGGTTPAS